MGLVRRFLIVLLVLVGGFVLVFGPRSRVQAPEGFTVVTYWEKWTGNEGRQMQEIVSDFNRTVGISKKIYVRYLSISAVNQKTLVSTAAGVPPDIAGLWDSNIVQFAAADALEPLEAFAASAGLGRDYYKPVYYDACWHGGHQWCLPSTPMAAALLWNKRVFHEKAAELRAAGLDPDRAPRTIDELNRYCAAIDTFKTYPDGSKRLVLAGHIPMEPGWYMAEMPYWFGGSIWDARGQKVTFTEPRTVEAFEWIRGFSERLGTDMVADFRSGFGSFNSAQNAFMTGDVSMVVQGPWMANYIEDLKPSMNRVKWSKEEEKTLPREKRKENYQWAFAPFPAAHGLENVTYCAFDMLCIPRGAKHKKEAFEFIAYMNRQEVMEKLCMLHCKNSPLAKVSENYLNNHPNPYIEVFDTLAASPNAHGTEQIPVYPEVLQELNNAIERIYLLQAGTRQALEQAQERAEGKWERYREVAAQRRKSEIRSTKSETINAGMKTEEIRKEENGSARVDGGLRE